MDLVRLSLYNIKLYLHHHLTCTGVIMSLTLTHAEATQRTATGPVIRYEGIANCLASGDRVYGLTADHQQINRILDHKAITPEAYAGFWIGATKVPVSH